MISLLMVAAGVEALTAIALIVIPDALVQLLFGERLSDAGLALAPLAGIALLALSAACWPDRNSGASMVHAVRGMLLYNGLAALYFFYRGAGGEAVGPLLWPAAVLHAILALLLGRAWLRLRGRQPGAGWIR